MCTLYINEKNETKVKIIKNEKTKTVHKSDKVATNCGCRQNALSDYWIISLCAFSRRQLLGTETATK